MQWARRHRYLTTVPITNVVRIPWSTESRGIEVELACLERKQQRTWDSELLAPIRHWTAGQHQGILINQSISQSFHKHSHIISKANILQKVIIQMQICQSYKHLPFSVLKLLAGWQKGFKNLLQLQVFLGFMLFKVIDVGTTGKLVSSACYDKQQTCVYLQPFSR